jgi:hypothetical protein
MTLYSPVKQTYFRYFGVYQAWGLIATLYGWCGVIKGRINPISI